MPNQVSGPNTSVKIIANSFLSRKYSFGFLVQNKHAGGKFNLALIRDLCFQIKEFNPDLIHISGLQGAGFHAVIAARLCAKKLLLTVRGSSIDARKISLWSRCIFGKVVEPLTIKLSHKVYTVSEAMARRDYIKKNAKGKLIGTIHNSAPKIDSSQIEEFGLRNKLGIDDEAIIVVIVGRIIYDKGVTYIAEAIRNIDDKRFKFVFIGDEPRKFNFSDTLTSEIEEKRVFFLGKQEKVLSILKECDIFLFATLHENLSNSLLEACSLGLAVIATDVGGNPEVIQHGYNGLLIPPANFKEMVESLKLLGDNKYKRLKFGEFAKKIVTEKFTQEFVFHKLENVYDEMINPKQVDK
jgi:glycosyltransferase involved in cell wall biosynthesis